MFNDLYLDILILLALVFTIAVVCFIPSMILALWAIISLTGMARAIIIAATDSNFVLIALA